MHDVAVNIELLRHNSPMRFEQHLAQHAVPEWHTKTSSKYINYAVWLSGRGICSGKITDRACRVMQSAHSRLKMMLRFRSKKHLNSLN